MLTIHDEQLVRRLEQIAQQENRPVEDVIKSMVEQHESAQSPSSDQPAKTEAIKQVQRKLYRIARKRWQALGDMEKAALTDEQLDEQFDVFDEQGIPRLKSEMNSVEPPPGSLAYAARIFEDSDFHSGQPDLAERSREILKEHFADDLLKQMRDSNAAK